MRSSLLCTRRILTHSAACHCTPMAQLKAWWDEPSERLMHFYQTFGLHKAMNLKSIKPRMETPRRLSRPSPYMPKHSPSWMSAVNAEVAASTTDHDRPLSCFGFCFHHLRARCWTPGHCDLVSLVLKKSICRATCAGPILSPSLCLCLELTLESTVWAQFIFFLTEGKFNINSIIHCSSDSSIKNANKANSSF